MPSPFSQPSPGSPATSSAEEEQYQQKKVGSYYYGCLHQKFIAFYLLQAELSQYIPTVMKVINKYTSRGTPEDGMIFYISESVLTT